MRKKCRGCGWEKEHKARGLCAMCYMRWWRAMEKFRRLTLYDNRGKIENMEGFHTGPTHVANLSEKEKFLEKMADKLLKGKK